MDTVRSFGVVGTDAPSSSTSLSTFAPFFTTIRRLLIFHILSFLCNNSAGCWGQRGVQSIIDGGFQCVSAHLAVDAKGGKFWQQMLAERAIQGACGPESHVKVFSRDEDISLEFCDSTDADRDCVLTKEGKPIRHVRLDCRVALYDKDRRREFVIAPTRRIDRKVIQEEAPWFL